MIVLAGGCIVKNNKVLLVQQTADGDQPNKWGPPAGHSNPGESLLETANREIKEETGLEVNIIGVTQAGVFEYKDKNYAIVLYYCELKNSDKNVRKQKKEVQNYVWASLKEIQQDKYPLRKKLLKEPLILALTQPPSPFNVFALMVVEKN